MGIQASLAGKRIFITGSTGFLGTALVERLLRTVPTYSSCSGPTGRRASPTQRTAREILKNDCFDRLRAELGDRFDAEVSARITSVAGDVARDGLGLDEKGRAELARCDIAIHSAATVSFDAPLDQAVEINMLGPSRVAAAVVRAREEAAREGAAAPHT